MNFFRLWQQIDPAVNLLKLSPTAMGRTSPFDFGNAISREADNKGIIAVGTLPSAINEQV